MPWHQKISSRTYFLIAAGILVLFAATLYLMGQVAICKCGYVKLWHGVTSSSENSQHLSDWYTFSHIIHGLAFYWLLWWANRKWNLGLPFGLRLALALIAETSWELFENTDFIINRYRAVTISLDYYGDSVINSVFDVLFMVVGFFAAQRLPISLSILSVIGMELFVGYLIRDNLTLNIIMLIYPFPAILKWQMGG